MTVPTRSGLAGGCLYSLVVAAVTGLLLILNGSIVLVVIKALARTGQSVVSRPDVAQLLLLAVPVLMVVAEWKMIDYVWKRLRKAG